MSTGLQGARGEYSTKTGPHAAGTDRSSARTARPGATCTHHRGGSAAGGGGTNGRAAAGRSDVAGTADRSGVIAIAPEDQGHPPPRRLSCVSRRPDREKRDGPYAGRGAREPGPALRSRLRRLCRLAGIQRLISTGNFRDVAKILPDHFRNHALPVSIMTGRGRFLHTLRRGNGGSTSIALGRYITGR